MAASGAVTVTITVNCPTITIGPASLPNGTTGTAYPATQLTQTGGTLPITWDLAAGALPTGLTLSASGFLSGTPTAAGTFNFTARATDANGCSGTLAYSVNIVCPTITVTTTGAVPNGVVGQAYSGVQFQQTGGTTADHVERHGRHAAGGAHAEFVDRPDHGHADGDRHVHGDGHGDGRERLLGHAADLRSPSPAR